jgi:N-acetylglucosaminyl-diphospho-decaprenol L-rhamnosyltransferase
MVSVVIVNFRTPDLTADAVRSALAQPETQEVIVVDNASGDGSADRLCDVFSGDERVHVHALDKNGGFGAGNNFGVRQAVAPYVFLLNSDAFFHDGALAKLLPVLETQPDVGLVAPAVYLEDGKTLQPDGWGIFPSVKRLLLRRVKQVPETLEPEWVTGAAMMMRRDEFLALGGFEEQIFMYYEDVLLCWRYCKSGKRILRELSAGVTHLGGRSNKSTWRQKKHYYAAQDVMLRQMGEPPALVWMLRLVRWPNQIFGRIFRS